MIAKLKKHFWKRIARFVQRKQRISQRVSRWYYTNLTKITAASCGRNLHVNYESTFSGECHFGDNCNFNGMCVRGAGLVKFGNNFHSGENCRIITQNHNYDGGAQIPYDSTYILKKVIIEDNVWFCDNVTVVGNVTIGEGSILAAGAVVSKDVPKCAIVGGNPAKVIKYRDITHYEELKARRAYH